MTRYDQVMEASRASVARLQDAAGLERFAIKSFRRRVAEIDAQHRRERLERLAAKWGARLVVGGRVVREGGAR